MHEILDPAMFDFFDGLFLKLTDMGGVFLADAQAIAAIFMLLFFANEAYKMMSGDEQLRIMPLFRPFALTLVIVFWGGFIDAVNLPLKVIDNTSRAMYQDQVKEVDALHFRRLQLIDIMAKRVAESTFDFEQVVEEKKDKSWAEEMGFSLDPLWNKMKGYYVMVMARIQFVMMQMLETIVLMAFQVCVYIVYFLKIIFGCILVILGPFSFAMSILPGFRDSYLTWIGRYISVSFYSTIAYLIMSISFELVKYGLEVEIQGIETALKTEEAFIAYISFSFGVANLYVVSLVLGGLAMLTIPVISTWIVNSSGIGQAASSMAGGLAKGSAGMVK